MICQNGQQSVLYGMCVGAYPSRKIERCCKNAYSYIIVRLSTLMKQLAML